MIFVNQPKIFTKSNERSLRELLIVILQMEVLNKSLTTILSTVELGYTYLVSKYCGLVRTNLYKQSLSINMYLYVVSTRLVRTNFLSRGGTSNRVLLQVHTGFYEKS